MAKRLHPRLQYLQDVHAAALHEIAAAQDALRGPALDPLAAFRLVVGMDPTPNGMYLTALVRWLLPGTMRFEDARMVRDLLEDFHRGKHRMPAAARDIGRYRSPGDLAEAMAVVDVSAVHDVPAEVLERSEVVAEGAGWTIFAVKDVDTAMQWAEGTRWCTKHRVHAERYLSSGPLHVVVSRMARYQFHGPTAQLADEMDRTPTEMIDVPDAGIHAIMDIARKDVVPDARFLPSALIGRIEDVLESRSGTRRPAVFAKAQKGAHSFMSLDGCVVVEPSDALGKGWHVVHRDGRSILVSVQEFVNAMDDNPILKELVESAFREAASMASGPQPVEMPRQSIAMGLLLGVTSSTSCHFVANGVDEMFVWAESRSIGAIANGFYVLHRNAHILELVHITKPEQSAILSREIVEGLLRLRAHVVSPFLITMLGLPGDDECMHWRTHQVQNSALTELIASRDSLSHPRSFRLPDADLCRLIAGPAAVPSLLRLLEGISHCSTGLLTAPLSTATPDDLLAVSHVAGHGALLAAIPDAMITQELVDRLSSNPISGVLFHLPAQHIVPERVRSIDALQSENAATRFASIRSLSHATWKAVKEARMRAMHPARTLMSHHFALKGTPTLLSFFHRARRVGLADESDLRNMRPTDDRIRALLALPDLGSDLRVAFEGMPPSGLPWPLAMERLEHSLDGLDEVLDSLHDLGWGKDVDARLADLRAIKGAAAKVDAFHAQQM